MANPLSDTLSVIQNNKDYAVKAYEVSNQAQQVENQLRQVQIQEKAQNLKIGEDLMSMSERALKLADGPLKKLAIKNMESYAANAGVRVNPEYFAALQDKTYAPKLAETFSLISGLSKDDPRYQSLVETLPGNISEEKFVDDAINLRDILSKQKTAKVQAQANLMGPIVQKALDRPETITPEGANTIARATTDTQKFIDEPDAGEKISQLIQGRSAIEQADYSDKKSAELLDIEGKRAGTPGYILTQKAGELGALGTKEEGTGVLSKSVVEKVLQSGKVKHNSIGELISAAKGAEGTIQSQVAQEKLKVLESAAIAEKQKEERQAKAGDKATAYAKEYQDVRKRFEPREVGLSGLEGMLNLENNAAAGEAAKAFFQSGIEGVNSIIRPSDDARLTNPGGLWGQVQRDLKKVSDGDPFTPKMRQNLRDVIPVLRENNFRQLKASAGSIMSRVKKDGIDRRDVFGEDITFLYGNPKNTVQIKPGKINRVVPGTGTTANMPQGTSIQKQVAPVAPQKSYNIDKAAQQYLQHEEGTFTGPAADMPEAVKNQVRSRANELRKKGNK